MTAVAVTDESGNGDEWIAYIAEAVAAVNSCKEALDTRVVEAREAGCSWDLIARGTATSRQNVTKRFAKLCR